MAAAATPYIRLPGRGTAGMQRCRLWLGPDHLLLVAASAIGERYKRFYFADIQSLVLHRKWSFPVASLLWLPFIAWAAGAAAFAQAGLAFWALIAATAALAAGMIAHLVWLGRGCKCYIRTAVQTEQIPTLHRLRTAQKVLARIRPLIEAAQANSATAATAEPR
jgi:hypothetical protein